ncbi:MAG: M2 family metallopeptidase [Holophagaceae bacterium]|uniref:M2 family metallopeptidase n=1 Tax=Candidatus Geothrix skivensis TaxID=2954439 RepID=A0A9D7SI53_9BACT|nr:M2 family metallopeptidase [Candidatus Geothrix skivensis]
MRLIPALILGVPLLAQLAAPVQDRADRFLKVVNAGYQSLYYVASEAQWAAATDVKPAHDAAAEWAGKAAAAFNGNPALITEARELLGHRRELKELTVRQLERVLLNAAEGPMTHPRLVADRIAAETAQNSTLNSFVWKLEGQPLSANQIDELLARSTSLPERLKVWEASKENGPALKAGLLKLRDLRNGCANALGYPDYFALQVAKYGLSTDEMMAYNRKFRAELMPLYLQLHTWVKYEMAKKYAQPVPKAIPAHWINNRWSQNWTGFVKAVDFDPYFKGWQPERIVKTAEAFYTGLGFEPLPASFWTKSDLYPVKAGDPRKKNSHASCWHLDLDTDIRSLMSVEANAQWFETTHHELGHGYYFMCYTNATVPPLLRDGANPSFHEGMGELIALATRQIPYLKSVGVLPADYRVNDMDVLLNDALEVAIPFMFWACGTMPEWEAEFYGKNMPADQMNARWWQQVRDLQGVEPPSPRGEQYCDAATKTHINDNPAYYYSYGWATVFKFQVHDHIARKILHQDPRATNYAGNKQVGAFLKQLMAKGATEDWRKVLKEATGEDLSTRAMMDYFKPLMAWLEKQNKGRQIGWN